MGECEKSSWPHLSLVLAHPDGRFGSIDPRSSLRDTFGKRPRFRVDWTHTLAHAREGCDGRTCEIVDEGGVRDVVKPRRRIDATAIACGVAVKRATRRQSSGASDGFIIAARDKRHGT